MVELALYLEIGVDPAYHYMSSSPDAGTGPIPEPVQSPTKTRTPFYALDSMYNNRLAPTPKLEFPTNLFHVTHEMRISGGDAYPMSSEVPMNTGPSKQTNLFSGKRLDNNKIDRMLRDLESTSELDSSMGDFALDAQLRSHGAMAANPIHKFLLQSLDQRLETYLDPGNTNKENVFHSTQTNTGKCLANLSLVKGPTKRRKLNPLAGASLSSLNSQSSRRQVLDHLKQAPLSSPFTSSTPLQSVELKKNMVLSLPTLFGSLHSSHRSDPGPGTPNTISFNPNGNYTEPLIIPILRPHKRHHIVCAESATTSPNRICRPNHRKYSHEHVRLVLRHGNEPRNIYIVNSLTGLVSDATRFGTELNMANIDDVPLPVHPHEVVQIPAYQEDGDQLGPEQSPRIAIIRLIYTKRKEQIEISQLGHPHSRKDLMCTNLNAMSDTLILPCDSSHTGTCSFDQDSTIPRHTVLGFYTPHQFNIFCQEAIKSKNTAEIPVKSSEFDLVSNTGSCKHVRWADTVEW